MEKNEPDHCATLHPYAMLAIFQHQTSLEWNRLEFRHEGKEREREREKKKQVTRVLCTYDFLKAEEKFSPP